MAKKQKAEKGKKRGPKEKRLVITEDPQAALARLLKAQPKKQTRSAKRKAEKKR